MSWPCPDCGAPFVPDHMCLDMAENLQKPDARNTWRWLARTMMLEARSSQLAFQIEQHLRLNEEAEKVRDGD